jgi:hypothetical protein|tara:strand:+ start:1177 stop:1407 length:231 start_codon:yes stop_codon:yes gene_type:complete
MRKETYEDGWDCEPRLQEAVKKIEELNSFNYEINNCVRATALDSMVIEMTEMLEDAISILNEIDTDVEFKTVDDER